MAWRSATSASGLALGGLGLIPFAALSPPAAVSLDAWCPQSLQALTPALQCSYGASILSFLGAVHWGSALSNPRAAPLRMALSVVPSLAATATLVAPLAPCAAMQALGFVGCLALDMAPMNREQLPHWYRHLRVPLSIGAAASMLLTAAAYRHTHGMDSGLSVLRPVYLQRPPSVSIFADASKQA